MEPVLSQKILEIKKNIKKIYLLDKRPIVIGFSGGKDSSMTLQLVIESLLELYESNQYDINKATYVISSDTLIENPFVETLIGTAFLGLERYRDTINLVAVKVCPPTKSSFWVSLLGKGYPLPLNRFRWCTRQIKISPMNETMSNIVHDGRGIISVLGIRSSESLTRNIKMESYSINNPNYQDIFINSELSNSLIFAPITHLSVNEVWEYLLSKKTSAWGSDFGDLYEMYWDSTKECPVMVDIAMTGDVLNNCGKSRWGCWMCSLSNEIWLDNMVNNGLSVFRPLSQFRKKMLEDRDARENRYMGAHFVFEANQSRRVVVRARGLTKLRELDTNSIHEYVSPKKNSRMKKRYRLLDDEVIEVTTSQRFPLISADEYYKRFIENKESFFSENGSDVEYFVKRNNDVCIPATGPYTLTYRANVLIKLLYLQKEMMKADFRLFNIKYHPLISNEEIQMIFEYWKEIGSALNKDDLVSNLIVQVDNAIDNQEKEEEQ